jgi:ferredoxin--NADP+ reductase
MAVLEYNATLIQRVEIAPGLVILRIVPDLLPFRFEAGQYTVLGMKQGEPRIASAEVEDAPPEPERMIRRAYSIASSSKADEYVEFYITLVASGELTPRLLNLAMRDRLWMGTKATGLFTLDRVPPDRHVLLVGTGTGLAPYMSMLRSELVCGGPRRFIVLHGARFSWDLGYRTELTTLSRLCSNMTYLPVISRPQEDPTWRGLGGYLQDVLVSDVIQERTGLAVTPGNFHVFLCGNPAMIDEATARMSARGFVPDKGRVSGSLHTEVYW